MHGKPTHLDACAKSKGNQLLHSGGSRISQTGVANPWVWGENLLFGKIFAKNCMKMKEIGPAGGCPSP